MASTTVNFNLKTAGYVNYANQTLTFRLLTLGAEAATGDQSYVTLPGVVTATSAANGDGSATLYRNGKSGIESVYEVILPNREKAQFIIPSGSATIELATLLVDHVPSGSTVQQSSVYAEAIKRANHTGTQLLSTISDAATVQLKPSEGAFANGDKTKLNGIEAGATTDQTNAEIRAAVEAATDSNVFTDADHTKLNSIAGSTTEEIQDIAGALVATGGTKTGIAVTYDDANNNMDFVVASQTDQNFTTADHSKLDGIEASATADQTASEIRTLVESATDSNVFTDADHTKLNNEANFVPRSISFTNTSSYLSLADNNNLDVGTGSFSLVFYAKLDSSGTEPVLDKFAAPGYRLRFVSGALILTLQDSGGSADFTLATGLNDNKWHTYVISIAREGNATTYVDNVAQTPLRNVSGSAGTLDNSAEFRIGYDGTNAADGVALGNYVILIKQPLDAGEAAQVYFDPNGIKLTDSPSVMVDLRRADRTFTDVSSNALAVTTNGTIIYNQERITSLDGATIGATTPAAVTGTAISGTSISVTGTAGTVKLPSLTTTQRDTLTAAVGMLIYNSTTSKIQARAGSAWVDLH